MNNPCKHDPKSTKVISWMIYRLKAKIAEICSHFDVAGRSTTHSALHNKYVSELWQLSGN